MKITLLEEVIFFLNLTKLHILMRNCLGKTSLKLSRFSCRKMLIELVEANCMVIRFVEG